MADKLEVSFNSPQCGWMSIGFVAGDREFHTTTAHEPHKHALPELLTVLASLHGNGVTDSVVNWSRNPEALDFHFRTSDGFVEFKIVEFPTRERETSEIVFEYRGEIEGFCRAFLGTFEQLHEDRETDEFEFNWHQPFPYREFQELKTRFA